MNWLVVAYAVFWTAVFVYTWTVGRKQKELDRRLDELRRLLADQNPQQ